MKRSFLLAVVMLAWAAAQDNSRQIWDDYFGAARPKAQSGSSPVSKPRYHSVSRRARPALPAKGGGAAVGVTVWKLEPPSQGDGARLLVQEPSGPVQLTPHRLEAGEPIHPGDRVRLSIETPKAGYIYVFDQEMYEGGKVGPPYLIFPTKRARGGDNRVRAGELLEIPAQTDQINAFTIEPKNAGERGEKLTLIVCPEPIAGLAIAEREQQIPTATFDAWVSRWGSRSEHFELNGGEGRSWTQVEKQAGQNGSRLLTQEDPAPQSVFVFPAKAGKPIVAAIELRVRN